MWRGRCQPATASIFLGSVETPWFEMTCPKYDTCCWKNAHFSALALRPSLCSCPSTISSRWRMTFLISWQPSNTFLESIGQVNFTQYRALKTHFLALNKHHNSLISCSHEIIFWPALHTIIFFLNTFNTSHKSSEQLLWVQFGSVWYGQLH